MDVGTRVETPAWSARRRPAGDRYGVVVTRPVQGGRPVMVGTWFIRLEESGHIVGFGSDALVTA